VEWKGNYDTKRNGNENENENKRGIGKLVE